MSGKIYKKIRHYAKLRGLNYKVCKAVYMTSSEEDKKKFQKEMEMAPFNDPLIKFKDRFTGDNVEFDPSEKALESLKNKLK